MWYQEVFTIWQNRPLPDGTSWYLTRTKPDSVYTIFGTVQYL